MLLQLVVVLQSRLVKKTMEMLKIVKPVMVTLLMISAIPARLIKKPKPMVKRPALILKLLKANIVLICKNLIIGVPILYKNAQIKCKILQQNVLMVVVTLPTSVEKTEHVCVAKMEKTH